MSSDEGMEEDALPRAFDTPSYEVGQDNIGPLNSGGQRYTHQGEAYRIDVDDQPEKVSNPHIQTLR